MATIKRVSPLKPGLKGARNWMTAQVRHAQYSRKAMVRFVLSLFLIFAGIIFLALWLAGLLPDAQRSSHDVLKNRLMKMGFVVEHVDVIGEGAISENDVIRALGVSSGDYLFEADLKNAQDRIEDITWVERAIVRRLWPDRIVVQIIERKPYALWQNNNNFYLVDKDGAVISAASISTHSEFPLIVGAKAPENYGAFKLILDNYPDHSARMSALVYHNTGRWDVLMNGDALRVKLPARNPQNALQKLQQLQASRQILDREIGVIDLRLSDRIVLQSSQEEPA